MSWAKKLLFKNQSMWRTGRWLWLQWWLLKGLSLWKWQLCQKQWLLVGSDRWLLWKAKKYVKNFLSMKSYFDFMKIIWNPIFLFTSYVFQNIQTCVLETFLSMLLLLEIMNQDQHQVQDVRVLASLRVVDGVQAIATPRMEIGVPNVLHVQVNKIFVKFTNLKLQKNTVLYPLAFLYFILYRFRM